MQKESGGWLGKQKLPCAIMVNDVRLRLGGTILFTLPCFSSALIPFTAVLLPLWSRGERERVHERGASRKQVSSQVNAGAPQVLCVDYTFNTPSPWNTLAQGAQHTRAPFPLCWWDCPASVQHCQRLLSYVLTWEKSKFKIQSTISPNCITFTLG